MKLTLLVAVAIAAVTLAPTRAHADCTEDGSSCPGLAAAFAGVVVGGAIEGSAMIGGIVTMIGGANDVAHHRMSRGWRIANYVFAGLNLSAGLAWGILAAKGIETDLGIGLAASHLTVGAADLTVALLAAPHSHDVVALALAPMGGRDVSGHSISGVSLKLTF